MTPCPVFRVPSPVSRRRASGGPFAAGCLSLLLLWGCGRPPEGIVAAAEVRAPAILVSEIESVDEFQKLVDCTVEFRNLGGAAGKIALVGTGCSCYGVSLNGEAVEKRQPLSLPSGETLVFQIGASPSLNQASREFTATFAVHPRADEPGYQHQVVCRLNIYEDLRLSPEALTIERRSPEPTTDRRTLRIEHVFRSSDGESGPPSFPRLPEFCQVVGVEARGPAEKLEDDLWRRTWEASLELETPAVESNAPLRAPFTVQAEVGARQRTSFGAGQIVVRSAQPIAFPSRVHFGKLAPAESRQRRILVASTDASPFTLQCDPDLLPAGVRIELPDQAALRHWVQLTVTPAEEGAFAESIALRTDHPLLSALSIELQGLVAGPGN